MANFHVQLELMERSAPAAHLWPSPQNQDPQCRHGFLETSPFFEGLRAPYMAPYIAPYIAPYMAPYIAPYMAPIYIAPYGAL